MSSRLKHSDDAAAARFHMLFLVPKREFDTKLDRDRFASVQAMEAYLKPRGGVVLWCGPGWPGWVETDSVNTNLERLYPLVHVFDLALLYEAQDMIGIAKLAVTKVITCNEMYLEAMIRKHASCKPDYFILHHTTEEKTVRDIANIPVVHLAHGADQRVYKPTDKPKKWDFVLVGRQCASVYPLRAKLLQAIALLKKDGYACHVHTHPGYVLSTPTHDMRVFAETIQAARIALTCSSKYKYRLSKYAEVPLCGTALAADLPKDGAAFFKEFIIELKPSDTVTAIRKKLIAALPYWQAYAEKGLRLTQRSSLQAHYAKRFFDTYERMNVRRTLTLEHGGNFHPNEGERLVVSNHCSWFPDRPWIASATHKGLKVPHQEHGALCKRIHPRERSYSLASLALEYTLMRWLSENGGCAPPVGNVVKLWASPHAVYGYEIQDANTLPRGPILSPEHAVEVLRASPLLPCSEACLNDLAANVVNGYFVDGRRSPQSMYRWRDPRSLYRIPEVNMITRKVLLVVDVKGWAWDYKAQSIRDNFRQGFHIDIAYEHTGAPKYKTETLENYDHVHFFSWRSIDPVARQMQADGLITVSTTIASNENELDLPKCVQATKDVRIAAVSPYIYERSIELFPKCAGVHSTFNGVETEVFTPRPLSDPPLTGPLKVLMCNKPAGKTSGYDCHGLVIAQMVKNTCDAHGIVAVTLHVSKHNSDNKLDRDAMHALYKEHDVFVHTGRHHLATPNMAFEAASCALPIVSTANGCLPALFAGTDGEVIGALVDIPFYRPHKPTPRQTAIANDKDAQTAARIVAHLEALTRERAQEMGRAARKAVVDDWTWAQRAQDYLDVFRD